MSAEADSSRMKRDSNSRLSRTSRAMRFARHTGKISTVELARVWKISPRALYVIINRQRAIESAAALPRSGQPNILTGADEAVLSELSDELDGNYTWDEITRLVDRLVNFNARLKRVAETRSTKHTVCP